MFTGQIACISNKATWQSDYCELIDAETDIAVDLSVATEIQVYLKDADGCHLKSGSLADGKVVVIAPGFQWTFQPGDLSGIRAGTYGFGIKVTLLDFVEDLVIGTVAVIEGN